jgi:hypothetical protein
MTGDPGDQPAGREPTEETDDPGQAGQGHGNLGPALHSGGEQEPGGLVPPYEGRSEGGPRTDPISSSSGGGGPVGEGRTVSDEERDGVPATDTTAATPLGVGESMNRRAEDVAKQAREKGEHEHENHGEQGESGRPAGTQEPTGIAGDEPIHPDSPNLQPGDQGG